MPGMRDASGALCKDGFCFAVGTLVHTKEGLVPIENVKIGDWVLSQPEATGERAYKRVVRTTRFENKAVYRVRCYSESNGGVAQSFIVTGNHPFFVADYDKNEFPKYYWPQLDNRKGWQRADSLLSGALLELVNGDLISVSSVDPIWRTKTEGVGWIGARDYEVGHYIDLRDGQLKESYGGMTVSDLLGVDDFNERYETEEQSDKWAYKCDVYNFEVEDFHTYYVGELGVWVHNTNCFEELLKPFKCKGKLTSLGLEVDIDYKLHEQIDGGTASSIRFLQGDSNIMSTLSRLAGRKIGEQEQVLGWNRQVYMPQNQDKLFVQKNAG